MERSGWDYAVKRVGLSDIIIWITQEFVFLVFLEQVNLIHDMFWVFFFLGRNSTAHHSYPYRNSMKDFKSTRRDVKWLR